MQGHPKTNQRRSNEEKAEAMKPDRSMKKKTNASKSNGKPAKAKALKVTNAQKPATANQPFKVK